VKKIAPAFLIAAVAFLAYLPALRNGFVWDDTALVQRDPLIRSWRLIPEGFQHFLFTDATASDFYRPIQRLTYTLDYAAFGFNPQGYHFTSIVWHVGAALALLLLGNELLRFFGVEEQKRRRIAFFAALAWSLHPLATSAVAYISGRADPLAATFGFLGLYCGIRSIEAKGTPRRIFLIATGALLLLSALSKEAGLIFLVLWGAIILLQRKWRELIPATVVTLFVSVIYLVLRLSAEHVPPPTLHPPIPPLVRPIVVARAVAEYTGLITLPINLHMERDVETHPKGEGVARADNAAWRELQTILGILLAAALLFWLVRSRKKDSAVFCCLSLALIAYVPISGIFPLNSTVAEHWIYLPAAFLFLAGMLAISRLAIPSTIVGAALAIWLLFLGVRTWIRTLDWKDQRTFIERTIASGGDSPRMWINLAGLDISEGQLDSAKKHLIPALQQEPNQPLAVLHLATIAIQQNDLTTARDLLNRASKMPLVDARAYELLAWVEEKEHGKLDLIRMRLASHTGPVNWSIEKRYIQALDQAGSTPNAIAELKSCLTNQWYRADSWQLLSELLAKTGQTADAAAARAQAGAYDVHLARPPS
jgi:tetratricopeptide (TPR) repeat protein